MDSDLDTSSDEWDKFTPCARQDDDVSNSEIWDAFISPRKTRTKSPASNEKWKNHTNGLIIEEVPDYMPTTPNSHQVDEDDIAQDFTLNDQSIDTAYETSISHPPESSVEVHAFSNEQNQTDNDSTDNGPELNLSQILEDDSLTTSVVDGQKQQQHGFGNSLGESAADVEEIEYDLEYEMEEETRTNKARAGSKMEEKRFKCKICSYSTKYKQHLSIHSRTHTGEKPFKCTQCSYESAGAGNLKKHMRTHTGEKPYKCTQCSFASGEAGHLKGHMLTHTGKKPYKCTQCAYASAQASNLKVHMRIHTGEKPYKCSQCSYACAVSSALKSHMRTHIGEKPYKCNRCSYTCAVSSNLNSHMRTHI